MILILGNTFERIFIFSVLKTQTRTLSRGERKKSEKKEETKSVNTRSILETTLYSSWRRMSENYSRIMVSKLVPLDCFVTA